MMSYRDRAYCGARNCKHFAVCGDAANMKLEKQAENWWNPEGIKPKGQAPIAITPNWKCYEPIVKG